MSINVLIVDDEQPYLDKYSQMVKDAGASVMVAHGVKEGIEAAVKDRPEVIISDYSMHDGCGNDLAKGIRDVYAPKMMGITGGSREDFDKGMFSLRLNKAMAESDIRNAIGIMIRSADPSRDYLMLLQMDANELKDRVYSFAREILFIDLFCQAYGLAQEVEKGAQPINGVVLNPNIRPETVIDELKSMEPDVKRVKEQYDKFREIACDLGSRIGSHDIGKDREIIEASEEFAMSADVYDFLDRVISCPASAIKGDLPVRFHDHYVKLMQAVNSCEGMELR